MHPTNNRIAVCVYTTNAAETIRAVEIAKAIVAVHNDHHRERQRHCLQHQQLEQRQQINNVSATSLQDQTPSTDDLVLRFFTYRGCLPGGGPKRTIDYEHLIHAAGFDVEYFGSVTPSEEVSHDENKHLFAAAVLDDDMWLAFLQAERNHEGIFPPPYDECAIPYLRAIISTLREFQPDVVVYGLFPEVAVTSAIQGWKTVSFAAHPISSFRDWMMQSHHRHLYDKNNDNSNKKRTNPWEVIQKAAIECGLELSAASSDAASNDNAKFLKAIHPNRTIVCDFKCYYDNENLPSDTTVVGPIISSDTYRSKDVEEIELFLLQTSSSSSTSRSDDAVCAPIKVLLTMGSTGELTSFLEGLKALCHSELGTFRSVVMIPTVLDQSKEINALLQSAASRDDMYIVKKFVPTRPIMECVDVILCHGGQLTIQCALLAGVPIVGTPSLGEQLYNLENVERYRVGVCIPAVDWKEENIRIVLMQVGWRISTYKEVAAGMQMEFSRNGNSGAAKRAGSIVWEMINTQNSRS